MATRSAILRVLGSALLVVAVGCNAGGGGGGGSGPKVNDRLRQACDDWVPGDAQDDLITFMIHAGLIDKRNGVTEDEALESLEPSWDMLRESDTWWDAVSARFDSEESAFDAYSTCMEAVIEDVW